MYIELYSNAVNQTNCDKILCRLTYIHFIVLYATSPNNTANTMAARGCAITTGLQDAAARNYCNV